MSMKINKLEIENVKRIKAVKVEPKANGLTVIGGNNNQGKTSVLDSIAWALGGERYKPSQATREGSVIPPTLHIVMNNGLVVERKGKNSALKVTDPNGKKAGQQLLNEFVEQLALDLPKFMEASGAEKAKILLQIIGVGSQLTQLEQQEKELYQERLYIGRTADQKEKFAKEQPYYTDAPKDLISASELIHQQQEILARNGENQKKREQLHQLEQRYQHINDQMAKLLAEQKKVESDLEIARKSALDLHDESTEELEQNISNIEEINRKVRANLDKEKAEDDAKTYRDQYNSLTKDLEDVRDKKAELLNAAELPLPELSVREGELIYKGQKWDNMSGSDRLKVSTAIVRKLNPNCGFVLLDKLEQMDMKSLQEFGEWLEAEGLQAIATRVSTGDECSIIIEDGYVVGQKTPEEPEKMDDDSSSDSSGGGSSAGNLGGLSDASNMFQTTTVTNQFKDLAKLIKDAWKNADFTELGSIVGEKLNAALEKIPWKKIQNTCNKIAKSIATFLNGFLETTNWKLVGSTIAKGLNTAFGFVNTFAKNFHWKSLGRAISDGINGAVKSFDAALAGQAISNTVKGILDTIIVAIENTDWQQVGEKVREVLVNIDWKGIVSRLSEAIGAAFGGFAAFIGGLIGDAFTSAKEYFEGKIEECGGNVVLGIFKGITDAIKGIAADSPDDIFTDEFYTRVYNDGISTGEVSASKIDFHPKSGDSYYKGTSKTITVVTDVSGSTIKTTKLRFIDGLLVTGLA